jgi:hypothetical protein
MRIRRTFLNISFVCLLLAASRLLGASSAPAPSVVVETPHGEAAAIGLPNESHSLKFTVLGDFGTAEKPEYELAAQMAKFCAGFKLDLVVTVGDNLYGAERPQDFKAFNMDGKLYYSFKAPKESVRFFMLDSTYPVPEQVDWLEKELKGSNDDWKIVVFHHPLYSSGGRHGSDLELRATLEPLFIKYNVSVALTGHDHFYERIKPQHGIAHFVVGSGGQLAFGDIDKGSTITAKGFDTDRAFLAIEISGDKMYFNAVSREGRVVDSGIIERRKPE